MKKLSLLLLLLPAFFVFTSCCNNVECESEKGSDCKEETAIVDEKSGCPHAEEHHGSHSDCPHFESHGEHHECVHAKSDSDEKVAKCCSGEDHENCCQQTGEEPCDHHKS